MNEKILYRVNRFFAWLLVPVMAVNFVSGYAAVHPRLFGALVSKPRAFRLHLAIQPLTLALVLFHVVFHLRVALMRRGLGGPFLDATLGLLWLAGTAGATWLARLG
jgi:hypothetical protein